MDNSCKKLIKSKSGFRMVATDDKRSPFIIEEPIWKPDKEHHCRRCGEIFCSKCCETKLELPRMCFIDPVRICINCESQTRIESKFFDKDIKLLTTGAIFLMKNQQMDDQLLFCKLSPDHRFLLFEGNNMYPLDINDITSIKVDTDKTIGKTSLEIWHNSQGIKEVMIFDTTKDNHEKRISCNWIKAIENAYRYIDRSDKTL